MIRSPCLLTYMEISRQWREDHQSLGIAGLKEKSFEVNVISVREMCTALWCLPANKFGDVMEVELFACEEEVYLLFRLLSKKNGHGPNNPDRGTVRRGSQDGYHLHTFSLSTSDILSLACRRPSRSCCEYVSLAVMSSTNFSRKSSIWVISS